MAFDTVNERISALNISTFGLMAGLFIPLQASGAITTDDAENALGWYIGVDVPIGVAAEGEIVYATCPIVREVSQDCTIAREVSNTCEVTKEISETCEITREISATATVDD